MMIGSVGEATHGACDDTVEARARRDILSAVSRQLQLKFQVTKIAVTNWDRIRLNPTPNYRVYQGLDPASNSTKKILGIGPEGQSDLQLQAAGPRLFHFYGRAGFCKLLLDSLSFVLADAFFDRLGRAIHQ